MVNMYRTNISVCAVTSGLASFAATSSSFEAILSKMVESNRSGIAWLESNDIEKATKQFTIALKNQKKLEALWSTVVAPVASLNKYPPSSSCPEHREVETDSGIFDDNLFVRLSRESTVTDNDLGYDNDDDDAVFRDPIRVPAMEEITFALTKTNSTNSTSDRTRRISVVLHFLRTFHTYNLALVYHLRGIERKGSQRDLDRAGRLYELAMRREQVGSKIRRKSNTVETPSRFTPIFVLACLNNLAQIHYLSRNYDLCRRCYQHVQMTAARIRGVYSMRQRREQSLLLAGSSQPQRRGCSSDRERNIDFLPFFLSNALRSLSRFELTGASHEETNTKGPSRQKQRQTNHTQRDSAAAAA